MLKECLELDTVTLTSQHKTLQTSHCYYRCEDEDTSLERFNIFSNITETWQAWSRIQILSMVLPVLFFLRSCVCPIGFHHPSHGGPLLKGKGSRLIGIVEFEFEGHIVLPSVSVLCNLFYPPGSSKGITEGGCSPGLHP